MKDGTQEKKRRGGQGKGENGRQETEESKVSRGGGVSGVWVGGVWVLGLGGSKDRCRHVQENLTETNHFFSPGKNSLKRKEL